MILVSACLVGQPCRFDAQPSMAHPQLVEWVERGQALPVCPEQLGGLPTPRAPAEIAGGVGRDVLAGRARVLRQDGSDVTDELLAGAREVERLALACQATQAFFKENSPSCGSSWVHDGRFAGRKVPGCGVTTQLLRDRGLVVASEHDLGVVP